MDTKCKLCSSKKTFNKGIIKNGEYSKKFLTDYRLIACNDCGSNFISPTPTKEVLDFIYSNPEYSAWKIDENKLKNIRYVNFLNYFDTIKKYIKNGSVLDCGCATGYFLDIAKENGFECYGVEISEIPHQIASKKFPQKIFKGAIETITLPPSSLDLVTMFDYLEHVSDPEIVLKKTKGLIKKGGFLMITTPNIQSISMRLLGKNHSNYILEHLNLFTKKSLTNYLEKFDFEIINIFSAKKIVNLRYAENVFRVNKNILHGPIKLFNSLLPKKILDFPIKTSFGDMFVIAKKK